MGKKCDSITAAKSLNVVIGYGDRIHTSLGNCYSAFPGT